MAKKIVRAKHKKIDIPETWIKFLATGEKPENPDLELYIIRGDRDRLKRLWADQAKNIIQAWITERPGTRPWAWWEFDAPVMQNIKRRWKGTFFMRWLKETRRQVSGQGVTSWENYPAWIPRYFLGAPLDWDSIDEDDPPIFESEATYLDRFGLLSKSEKAKISPADFDPESIETILIHDKI